jgi:hypothetical protein
MKYRTLWICLWFLALLAGKANSQVLSRAEFDDLLKTSIFSAIIDVKDGRKHIRRVLLGNKNDFSYLEAGDVTNPEKDRSLLLVFSSTIPNPKFAIFMIRNNSIRYGAKKGDVIRLSDFKCKMNPHANQ